MASIKLNNYEIFSQSGDTAPKLNNSTGLNFSTTNQNFTIKSIDAPIVGATNSTADNPNSGQLAIYNGATKLWGINESGWVVNPNRPRSFAKFLGYTVGTTLGVSPVYETPLVNVGGFFDSTTGRFTCPIDGAYIVFGSFLRDTGSVVFRGTFYKNGTNYDLGEYRTTEGYSGYNESSTHSGIIEANAGDYLEWTIRAGSSAAIYNTSSSYYNYFSVCFLG